MASHPPPYATAPAGETKGQGGLYPSVGPDPSVSYQAQPGAGAPGYYPQQQQQPQVYVSPQPAVTVVQARPPQSYVAHIVFSCFVFWCCGCLCGLLAFIFASKSKLPRTQHFFDISHSKRTL